jgi:hypothetical protein
MLFTPTAGSDYLLGFTVVLHIIIIIIIIIITSHYDIVFCFIVSNAFSYLPGGAVVVQLFVLLLFCLYNPLWWWMFNLRCCSTWTIKIQHWMRDVSCI